MTTWILPEDVWTVRRWLKEREGLLSVPAVDLDDDGILRKGRLTFEETFVERPDVAVVASFYKDRVVGMNTPMWRVVDPKWSLEEDEGMATVRLWTMEDGAREIQGGLGWRDAE